MDLRSLNTFIQVAELGSFTRAGEKLGYSQPTISQQIKQLEKELGVLLFDRIGHTVSLTDDGRTALTYAQRICHISLEMTREAHKDYEPSGVVRLAMADSLCTPLLMQEFARFREQYPKVALYVTTAGTDEMFRLLDHNQVDMVCTLDNHIYNTTYIISDEEKVGAHFVCAVDNPLAKVRDLRMEDLPGQPFILTEKGMSYRRLMDQRMALKSIEIQPILEIGNADLICRLVEKDMGLSFLPDYVTQEAVRAGRLVRLCVQDFEVELWKQLLYRRDKWMSLPLEAIIRHLSQIKLGDS